MRESGTASNLNWSKVRTRDRNLSSFFRKMFDIVAVVFRPMCRKGRTASKGMSLFDWSTDSNVVSILLTLAPLPLGSYGLGNLAESFECS